MTDRPGAAFRRLVKAALRALLGGAMIAVGIMHFTHAPFFEKIVPAWLPAARLLVQISGVFEIALGAATFVPPVRRWAGFGLVALYLAVFPANVNMALHPELGGDLPHWALWARLPLQALFIVWALWATGAWPDDSASRSRG